MAASQEPQEHPETLRFLITSAQEGLIEVAWSREIDHHPVAVGKVQLRAGIPADSPMAAAAQAYVARWQRTTGRAL